MFASWNVPWNVGSLPQAPLPAPRGCSQAGHVNGGFQDPHWYPGTIGAGLQKACFPGGTRLRAPDMGWPHGGLHAAPEQEWPRRPSWGELDSSRRGRVALEHSHVCQAAPAPGPAVHLGKEGARQGFSLRADVLSLGTGWHLFSMPNAGSSWQTLVASPANH